MEAILDSKGVLMLTPESEFERSYLRNLEGKVLSTKVKTGLSQADFVGLKLEECSLPVGPRGE